MLFSITLIENPGQEIVMRRHLRSVTSSDASNYVKQVKIWLKITIYSEVVRNRGKISTDY
jgi:hypothetical protein